MKNIRNPELWLLTLIVGLPQFSETVYTPSLPAIAHFLRTTSSFVEYTLTVYLFGFAIGTLFWGKLSDAFGRRPSLIAGLVIYIIGCIACFYSTSIEVLLISRFIQAFGGSTGSILGQAICRDAFSGPERGKVFSIIGSALSFSPAVGPVIGGLIAERFGWSNIFLFLIVIGSITLLLTLQRLPETHIEKSNKVSLTLIMKVLRTMIVDKRVITFALLVAACNGIMFSYYAEGSFYLIDMLHIKPTTYGLTFILFAIVGFLGGYISKRLHDYATESIQIMMYGAWVILIGAFLFTLSIIGFHMLHAASIFYIIATLATMMCIMMGIGLMIPNVLSTALQDYRSHIGTASSWFGFFYYCLISLFTLIMGLLHNDTLLPMPLYFLAIAVVITVITYGLKKQHA